MSGASWELQKAVFAALGADAGVTALIGDPARIYDDAPAGAALPYVAIGEDIETDWSTATEAGSEHALTIHIWSRAGGRKEAKAILAAIRDALHDAAPALDDHAVVNLRFQFAHVLREPDGETWHGIARFRAVTEAT